MITTAPNWLRVETAGLPAELTQGVRYVVWKAEPRKGKPGKWEKAPRRSDTLGLASTTDPATWSKFSNAFAAYEQHPELTGIGRIMTDDDGMTGIDLDNSITEDGTVAPWAQEIIDALPGAYWEHSPSGTGLRGFCLGKLPPGRRKRTYQGASIEIYDDVRHLTLTGHALTFVEILPQLQEAVEAVHARWFSGGDAADGAIATTRTGQADTVTPEALKVLELVMGGKYAAQMADIWAGKTNSDQDWALACEIARHAIQLGHSGDDLGQVVEDVMRAGPWRPKWDRPWTVTIDGETVHTTYLGRTIGRAIATVQKRLANHPDFPAEELDDADDVTVNETLEQTIVRLQRELGQARTTIAVQQTVIKTERAERQGLADTIRGIGDILALPKEHSSPAFKIGTIITILEAHSKASRGVSKLASQTIEERTGLTKNMVSDVLQDLAARDGSPIKRRLTREWRTDEHGQQAPFTVSEVIPLHATVAESLAAVLAMGGPSTKAQQKKQAAQDRAEKSRQWGRCSSHDNDLVALKGYCPDCGEVVGERVVRIEEFDALNPLNPEIRETGRGAAPPVVVRTKGHEIRETGQVPLPTPAARPENHEVRATEPAPVSLLDYAATRADEPPDRCPAPGCRALEFKRGPDGAWRCLKSGHDPWAYKAFVPSSEWQEVPEGYPCPPGGKFRLDFQTGKNWARWPNQEGVGS